MTPRSTARRPLCAARLLALVLGSAATVPAGEAPAAACGWRGDGSGLFPAADPPLEWNADEGRNILWKTEVGTSQSSPIVAGDCVLATAEQDFLVCLDRGTGKVLWRKDNGYESLPAGMKVPGKRPPAAPGCGYSTPTPAAAGKLVYAGFGTGVTACYDLDGNRRWVRLIEMEQPSEYGRSASPVLAGGKLVLSLGGLVALDPGDGRTLWEAKEAKASFGTPAAARIGGVDVLITPMGDCVCLADGKVLAAKLGKMKYTSPLVADGIAVFAGSPTVAWKLPDAEGGSLSFTKLWENEDIDGESYASPVSLQGLIYQASNDGQFVIMEAKTGKTVCRKEADFPWARGSPSAEPANIYPSLAFVGKRLILSDDAGHTLVLEPGREYRLAGRNSLDKGTGASPLADGKHLFLRGGKWLYCIGAK